MRTPALALVLAFLAACANSNPARARALSPTVTLPAMAPAAEAGDAAGTAPPAPEERVVPFGIGFTGSPTTVMLGAALDFPMDEELTVGPAIHFGADDNTDLFAAYGQGKYFFTIDEESRFLPYATVGAGVVYLDHENRDDWGFLINGGIGVRIKTGDKYRIGSEALFNLIPGDAAGEGSYFSWQILQVILSF